MPSLTRRNQQWTKSSMPCIWISKGKKRDVTIPLMMLAHANWHMEFGPSLGHAYSPLGWFSKLGWWVRVILYFELMSKLTDRGGSPNCRWIDRPQTHLLSFLGLQLTSQYAKVLISTSSYNGLLQHNGTWIGGKMRNTWADFYMRICIKIDNFKHCWKFATVVKTQAMSEYHSL